MNIVATLIETDSSQGLYFVLDDCIYSLKCVRKNKVRYSPLLINGKYFYLSEAFEDWNECKPVEFRSEPAQCAFNSTQFWFGRKVTCTPVQVQLWAYQDLHEYAKEQEKQLVFS